MNARLSVPRLSAGTARPKNGNWQKHRYPQVSVFSLVKQIFNGIKEFLPLGRIL